VNADDEIRTDPKPADMEVDVDLVPHLLLQLFLENGDDDLVRAALDQRLAWVAEPFDEMGYRHVHVWFGGEEDAVARFHWSLLAEESRLQQ
jgi:hypothetical protein